MAKSTAVLKTVPKFPKSAPFVPGKVIRRKIYAGKTALGKRSKHFVEVKHERDPKELLFEKIGALPEEVVQFARILVAIYQPPMVHKTAGGLLLTEPMKEEDIEEFLWMGKVGLIVHMGPQAYEDDDTTKFHGTKNHIGDWVWCRPSDGLMVEVNEVPCRVLAEKDIQGKIPHPDMIW